MTARSRQHAAARSVFWDSSRKNPSVARRFLPPGWRLVNVGSVLRNAVTPKRKIFLAIVLVATGYGVAALLGAPDPRRWSDSWAQVVPNQPHSILSPETSVNANRVSGVRLLPESSAASLNRPSAGDTVAAAAPKAAAPSLAT